MRGGGGGLVSERGGGGASEWRGRLVGGWVRETVTVFFPAG